MLFHAHVPTSYWVDAFTSTIFIIHRLPTKLLNNHSTFQLLYSPMPSYGNFRTFGYQVYSYLRDYSTNQLSPRSIISIFFGYFQQYNGFKCLDPTTYRVYITRHERFDEPSLPFVGSISLQDFSKFKLYTFIEEEPSDHHIDATRSTIGMLRHLHLRGLIAQLHRPQLLLFLVGYIPLKLSPLQLPLLQHMKILLIHELLIKPLQFLIRIL